MKNNVELSLLVILLLLLFICYAVNETKWNNGHCSCGGNWVYQQAVGHRANTTYLYKCDKCGKVYEFYEAR